MKKFSVIKGLSGLAVMAMTVCIMTFSSHAAEGTIKAETARIRANTSTDSEVVGSTVKGKTIDILEAVKDSSGAVWYKVSVAEGGYGYIKGDLVEVSGTIEIKETSSSQSQESSSQSAQQPADTVPTSIGEQQAVIKSGNNVNVRTGASKEHAAVASLPSGTAITLIGEANDNSGNKWYQLTCSYNGRTIEGYVRSDLIEIGQGSASGEGGGEGTQAPAEGSEGEGTEAPAEGEAPVEGEGETPEGEEPAPEPVEEHNDYEVHYDMDPATNEYTYYLYLNNEGNKMKVSELLAASSTATEGMQKLQDQVEKEKIVIIILAVVVVVLFVVITILLFKIRNLYYEEDDEEEEEEEEEEEPEPVRRKVRRRVVEEEEEPVPVKKRRPTTASENQERTPRPRERSAQPAARGERELHAAERKEPVRKPAARKPQNFLIDDDEFEFEFLNMDDKDI